MTDEVQSQVENLILQKLETIEQKVDNLANSLHNTETEVARVRAGAELKMSEIRAAMERKIAEIKASAETRIAEINAALDKRLCDLEVFKKLALWVICFLVVTISGGALAFVWGLLTNMVEVKTKSP